MNICIRFLLFAMLFLGLGEKSFSETYYRFEKMFPLHANLFGLNKSAVYPVGDKNENIYIKDKDKKIIYKYSKSGFLVSSLLLSEYDVVHEQIAIRNNGYINVLAQKCIKNCMDNLPPYEYPIYDTYLLEFDDRFNKTHIIDLKDVYENTDQVNHLSYNQYYISIYNNIVYICSENSLLETYILELNEIYEKKSLTILNGIPPTPIISSVSGIIYLPISGQNGDVFDENSLYRLDNDGLLKKVISGEGKRSINVSYAIDNKNSYIYKFECDSRQYEGRMKVMVYNLSGSLLKERLLDEISYGSCGYANQILQGIGSVIENTSMVILPYKQYSSMLFLKYINNEIVVLKNTSLSNIFEEMFDIDLNDEFLFISDSLSNKISKYNKDFQLLREWFFDDDNLEVTPGYINSKNDKLFVGSTDFGSATVFDINGNKLSSIGGHSNNIGEGYNRYALSVLPVNNSIYITDGSQLLVYDKNDIIVDWYYWGNGNAEIYNNLFYYFPGSMASDLSDNVYIGARVYLTNTFSTTQDSTVITFNKDGRFEFPLATDALMEETENLKDIEIDSYGSIFTSNESNNLYYKQVKIFDKNRNLTGELGEYGSLATQLKSPNGVAVDDNYLYIADAGNHRIVVYRKLERPDSSKSILVAGGNEYGNSLWDETQANANHAFWTLANQGYTKDNIHYLNRNTNLDLDGNGEPDDVDGLPTRANVKAALTEWAKDAEDVVLYMVGHGGNGTFQLGGGEILTATELRTWLDELQAVMPGKVTVIYDACESGSFQKPLSGSPYPRTVITSTSAKALESAYFQDAISFSHLFWNEVFSGKTVSEAFQTTQTSINQAFGSQSPQIDSDGDGITNTANDYNVVAQQAIGNGTVYTGTAPTVGSVGMTPVGKGESTSTLTAYNISDDKGVQSVWAIVRPPYANLGQDGKPVQNLPRVDLAKQADGSYQGRFDDFEQPGTYQVIVYRRSDNSFPNRPKI